MKSYWVYILCSKKNGVLYIGITNNIVRRVYEHKTYAFVSFTSKYKVGKLVYAEEFTNINEAIYREKCLKSWKRQWKIRLIEEHNPNWVDLYKEVV
ncbi:GIY-YIG nuclease family protein [Candidatus Tisiphia endosymbiont of Ditula angustiorana]|uniref:GIY-YIG nuclease family protein n=1 Tax=Candidatus Tisiphia endosymbiont of Ditula angustiorana TaxID=3066272 RepID=UPI00312CB58E